MEFQDGAGSFSCNFHEHEGERDRRERQGRSKQRGSEDVGNGGAVVRVYLIAGCNEKISYGLIYMLSGCWCLSKTFEFLRRYAESTDIGEEEEETCLVDPPSRPPQFSLIIPPTRFRDSIPLTCSREGLFSLGDLP